MGAHVPWRAQSPRLYSRWGETGGGDVGGGGGGEGECGVLARDRTCQTAITESYNFCSNRFRPALYA